MSDKPAVQRASELARTPLRAAKDGRERLPARAKSRLKKLPDEVYQALVKERKLLRGMPTQPTRDTLIAFQYNKLSDLAPHVVRRIQRALENENDPLHEMVVDRLMRRLSPEGFWDALGKQEFAPGEQDRRPTVIINVGSAQAPAEVVVNGDDPSA